VDVEAGLVYLPTRDIPFLYSMPEGWQVTGLYQRRMGQWSLGVELERVAGLIVENIATAPAALHPRSGGTHGCSSWSIASRSRAAQNGALRAAF